LADQPHSCPTLDVDMQPICGIYPKIGLSLLLSKEGFNPQLLP